MKVNFFMFIVRDKDYKVLFNMLFIFFIFINGLMLDKFQQSVKMSIYLVVFIVCDFDFIINKIKVGINVSIMEYEILGC